MIYARGSKRSPPTQSTSRVAQKVSRAFESVGDLGEHARCPPAKAYTASSWRRARGRAVPRPMLLYGRHDGIRPIVEIRPRAEALLAQASPTFSAVSLPVVPD